MTFAEEWARVQAKHGDPNRPGYRVLHPRRGKVRWRAEQEPYYRGIEDSYWRHRDELEGRASPQRTAGGEAHRYAQAELLDEGYSAADIFLATQDHGDSPPGFRPYEPGSIDPAKKALIAEMARRHFIREAESTYGDLKQLAEGGPAPYRPTDQEVVEAVVMEAKSEATEGDLSIRVPVEVAGEILRDGRFKTQFETGTTQGTFDPGRRARIETENMNVPEDTPAELRPIYGYLEVDPDYTGSGLASFYGPIQFVLKKEARKRTTVTWSDSLDGAELAAPLAKIDDDTATDDEILAAIGASNYDVPYARDAVVFANEDGLGMPSGMPPSHWTTHEYLEAQIHGGVRISDIETVLFPPSYTGRDEDYQRQLDEVEKLAKELGIATAERDME